MGRTRGTDKMLYGVEELTLDFYVLLSRAEPLCDKGVVLGCLLGVKRRGPRKLLLYDTSSYLVVGRHNGCREEGPTLHRFWCFFSRYGYII